VRLLTPVGTFPAGTVVAVVSKNGLYEIEFHNGRRLIVDGNDVARIQYASLEEVKRQVND
jgi:hypothetical protein